MDITGFVVSHRDAALLIGDYNAYRGQLSRRILTVRKKLGRTTPRNGKYATKSPITAENIGQNHEYLHLLLLTSERAWAHAMHMKSSHAEDNAEHGNSGATRRHIVSRLSKASKTAKQLVALLSESTSGATKTDILEAQAYAYSLSGAEEFEKQSEASRQSDPRVQKKKWEQCLTDFATARIIYNALLQSTKKDLYKEVLASTIDPSIRYGAYQAHLPRSVAVTTVAKQYFPKDQSQLQNSIEELYPEAFKESEKAAASKTGSENVPNTVTWRSRKANIVDASIGQALAAVDSAETRLISYFSSSQPETPAKDKAAAYDDVLIASQDAADATRHAIDELEKEGVSEGDPRMQDLRVTSLAVNYAAIGWRVGRNRVLIGQDDGAKLEGERSKKPKRPRKDGKEWVEKEEGNGRKLARLRERVVLYDSILQSIDSVKELRGAVRDASFVEELDGKRAYFQALKCLNIAYSHALLSNPTNALALLVRANDLCTQAADLSLPSEQETLLKLDLELSKVKAFQSYLQALVLQYRGIVELHKFSGNSAVASKNHMTTAAPIVERLHEYPSNGVDLNNLVTYPPKLQPVPVKPLFFDVAWNYIEYPGQAKKVVENGAKTTDGKAENAEDKPAKRGWFGFGR